MICPRCGADQPQAPECAHCGILIAKYLARALRPAETPPAPAAADAPPRPTTAKTTPAEPPIAAPPAGPPAAAAAAPGQVWLTAEQKRLLFVNLDRLLSASVPLPEAMELAGQAVGRPATKPLRQLAGALQAHGDLLAELRRYPGLMDPVETALVATALQAGTLPAMCGRLARRQQHAAELSARLRGGLVYPALVLASSAVLTPLPLAFSQGVGAFLAAAAFNLGALVASAAAARWAWRRLQRSESAWAMAAFAEAIPGLRRAVHARRWALWFEVLGLTAQAGVPLTEGLRLAGAATGEPAGVRNSAGVATRLSHGTLSQALASCDGVPERAGGALRAAERSGHLADACSELGQEAHAAYARHLGWMVAALRTAAMAAVALWVAWSVVQQMSGLIGDPLSALPGPAGEELRRELERAMPKLPMAP